MKCFIVKYADSSEPATEHPFSRWDDANDYARDLNQDYPDAGASVMEADYGT